MALEGVDLFTLWLGRSIEAVRGDQSLKDWQAQTFEDAARQRFLELGSALDRVCPSVLQSDDIHLAQEWYFKLQDGDADFIQLAPQSLGRSRESGGHLGPLRLEELQTLPPGAARPARGDPATLAHSQRTQHCAATGQPPAGPVG